MRNIRWQKMALRAANGLLDGVTALLVLLAVVWSGYALWDNSSPTPAAPVKMCIRDRGRAARKRQIP